MTNAIVVFANGSRSMAHNLDDLDERWHLKKVDTSMQVTQDLHTSVGYAIPSVEGLEVNYDNYKNVLTMLMKSLDAANIRKSILKSANSKKYASEIHYLTVVYTMITAEIRKVKLVLKDLRVELMSSSVSEEREESILRLRIQRQELSEKLIEAQAEIIRLHKLLIEQYGLPENVVILSDEAI